MKPIISWHVLENDVFNEKEEYYLGNFEPLETVSFNLQLWNNKYGNENVDDIDNAKLSIKFEKLDDFILLNYCTVYINGVKESIDKVLEDKALVNIGFLSGEKNNGLDEAFNEYNFKDIKLIFENIPTTIRQGLKNIFLDVEYN